MSVSSPPAAISTLVVKDVASGQPGVAHQLPLRQKLHQILELAASTPRVIGRTLAQIRPSLIQACSV